MNYRNFAIATLVFLVLGLTWGPSVPVIAAAASAEGQAAEAVPETHEIKMVAENWKWTPKLIRVAPGTPVRLVVQNYDAPHRFQLKAYGLNVALPEDETTTIEFVADKPGKFRWRCSRPCGNGCAKMMGQLIVEE